MIIFEVNFLHMYSINDISIALNSLFLDIINPMTLGLNKTNFFNAYNGISFRIEEQYEFEFNAKPIFHFDDKKALVKFLEKELAIAGRYQDNSHKSTIKNMLMDINEAFTIEEFYLDYTIETDDNNLLIIFNTNSMIFKYEVIG